MQITHPQGSYNNLPSEDVFIASDDFGTQVGVGYLVYQYLQHRSPDCPVNIYFDINSAPQGWFLLLGAIVARARILRDRVSRDVKARIYTRVEAGDEMALKRFRDSGFDCKANETMFELFLPEGEGRVPMSCVVQPVPLNTLPEQQAFIQRLRQNDITHINESYLAYLTRLPHFQALALVQNGTLVGEVMVAGSGASCELMAIYTAPLYRHSGMAKTLLHRCMAVMQAEGVTQFGGVFNSMSEPQMRLAADFRGRSIKTQGYFPELQL